MKKKMVAPVMVLMLIAVVLPSGPLMADNPTPVQYPDKFIGDTAIYAGDVSNIKPNVLFYIDNSPGMSQPGISESYDPAHTYPGTYTTNYVYVRQAATGGNINYNSYISADYTTAVTCSAAKTAFQNSGYYAGKLKKQDGSCNATQDGNYYLGNLLNYMFAPSIVWTANTAYTAGQVVLQSAGSSTSWKCIVGGTSGAAAPAWPAIPTDICPTNPSNCLDWDNPPQITESTGVTWEVTGPIISMVTRTLDQLIPVLREKIKAGLAIMNGTGNKGGLIKSPVDRIDLGGGSSHYTHLLSAVDALYPGAPDMLTGNHQFVNEVLYDASWYYRGQNNSSQKIGGDNVSYPSPIEYKCQSNFIVVISSGSRNESTTTDAAKIGDQDSDADIGDVDDGAKLIFETDHSSLDEVQRVKTIVIQLITPREPHLVKAAAYGVGKTITYDEANTIDEEQLHGEGIYYYRVQTAERLVEVLNEVMSNIMIESNTAFVAPVVPVSPENRTYSGSRVYMGFFKPKEKKYWRGNIKKYGLDSSNNIVDKDGHFATYVDMDGNGVDDRDGSPLSGSSNGDFRPDSKSYWFTDRCITDAGELLTQLGDGGIVDCSGVGEKLKTRTTQRKIYTFLSGTMASGATQDLTAGVNAFCAASTCATSNDAITPRFLNFLCCNNATYCPGTTEATDAAQESFCVGAPPTARENLMKFVHGIDAYDEDGDLNSTEKRFWIMGDVLHSRPQIVSYKTYSIASESNCNENKSMIYVGANDGMLHAFKDCDGSEAWAFIPTNLLGNLRQLTGQLHVNFVDSSPQVYVYDADSDGNIESGDKVILLFGERRGGGVHNYQAMGFYFALDVTNPDAPWMITRFSYATNASLTQLGETWSEPKMGKVRIGSNDMIVAFIGAGYDNCNEDSRFGAVQTFPGVCAQTSTADSGVVSSTPSGTGLPLNPRGRGIYAMKVADLSASGVATTGTGTTFAYLWSQTSATDSNMNFSIPGEISLIDSDFNGYVDRLYVGDAGGYLWRFDVGSTSTSGWTGKRIFSANTSTSKGRKIFYRPAVTLEPSSAIIFFGTGDREHPLNRAVTDRMYAFFDKDGADYTGGPRTDANLVDVTQDLLQAGSDAQVAQALSDLSTMDGWFIKLDGGDRGVADPGEKVLASPAVFNRTVYFTTFAPSLTVSTDPCTPGNLGEGRVYALNYKTGEAVLNYDTSNDSLYSSYSSNRRATPAEGQVLIRSDRVMRIGQGIPSGIVQWVTPDGMGAGVGCGGGFCPTPTTPGGRILPIYWRQK